MERVHKYLDLQLSNFNVEAGNSGDTLNKCKIHSGTKETVTKFQFVCIYGRLLGSLLHFFGQKNN